MMNRTVLVGRMTRDPEIKHTGTGIAVTNFTIAMNRPFKNAEGNNDADFINVVVWKKAAENTVKYTKKGSLVGIDGRLQSRTYEGSDGKTVYVTEVVADSVQFLDSKGSNDGPANNKQEPFKGVADPIEINDSDLPF